MQATLRSPRFALSSLAFLLGALALLAGPAAAAGDAPIPLVVDATRIAEKLLHARSEIPVTGGSLTLVYPQWIPGEHGPTGPLANLVDLHFSVRGKEIPWRRDPLAMYSLQIDVPAGATTLVAEADFLSPGEGGNFTSGPGATTTLAVINWNSVVLYPAGATGDTPRFAPSLRLPAGWTFATALEKQGEADGTVRFAPVSLATLVDSPVLAGTNVVDLDLGVQDGASHHLVIAADRAADLADTADLVPGMARLVSEALALFGAHHYDSYRWLLALSDHVQHFGLEHHESSDNRREEETLVDEAARRSLPGLLAHEYVHSWNGKYRRPEGLLSPDFQKPMDGSLLWVYEGLTEHLGLLLPARAGFWTPEYYREEIASLAASLDQQIGRSWRPLGDTATAAQVLFGSSREGRNRRRGTDFYDESVFLWLDVDTTLREASGGKVTLDDFCHRFHGAPTSGPKVMPYTRQTVVATLQSLVPHDWEALFAERIDRVAQGLPMAGLERAGWRLTYNDEPNTAMADDDSRRKAHDWRFSLGFVAGKDGEVGEVLPQSPAGRAGMVGGVKLLGIGGYVYAPRAVEAALAEAQKSKAPIEIVAAQGEAIRTFRVDYHDGPRYPHLERIEGRPDVLSDILRAHAPAPRK